MPKYAKVTRRSNKNRNRFILVLLFIILLTAICSAVYFLGFKNILGIGINPKSSTSSAAASIAAKTSSAQVSSKEQVNPDTSVTILGAGDDLIHSSIYKQAANRTGGKGYDFAPVYARVANLVQKADISVVNQETVLAGKVLPVSNYPMFNSPTEVGEELVKIGFDVINHANNHILDMGVKGIKATLDFWDIKPVKVVGVYRNAADLENIRIVQSKGIKTAHIGITEMTNGLYLPTGSDYRLIYADNTQLIERLIKKAKTMADVAVISVHWGTEDTYTLTEKQKKLAQEMVDWGADIIFGNHPHVLQQLTLLTRSSDGSKCPVIFALGNFVSAQQYGRNMVSGLLTVTVTKSGKTGKTSYTGMKFTPLVTHYGSHYSNITIYPFSEYTDSLAAQHGVRAYTKDFSRSFVQNIIDRNIPKEYQSAS